MAIIMVLSETRDFGVAVKVLRDVLVGRIKNIEIKHEILFENERFVVDIGIRLFICERWIPINDMILSMSSCLASQRSFDAFTVTRVLRAHKY